MVEVNPQEFRHRSVSVALEASLSALHTADLASEKIEDRFRNEAAEWISVLEESDERDFDFTRVWGVVDAHTAAMLDLILVADDAEWASWHRAVRQSAESLRPSFTVDLLRPSSMHSAAGDSVIEVLRVTDSFHLDLTNTPARWRSLEGLTELRPERMQDLAELVNTVRASLDESLQEQAGLLSPRQVLRSVEFQPLDSIDFGAGIARLSSLRPGVAPISEAGATSPRVSSVHTTEELLDRFKGLTLVELEQFVKAFEEKFEVTASAPVAVGPSTRQSEGITHGAVDVILESVGEQKIQVIKAVRELTSLGLGEAKAIVDKSPIGIVLEAASPEVAAKAKSALEQAGAAVKLRVATD